MKRINLILIFLGLIVINSRVWSKEVAYTLEDRDRLIRVETRLNEMDKRIDEVKLEIKDVRTEIKDVRTELKGFMTWGFGVTFAGIFSLMGFVLWDRRTALAPAVRKNKELEERGEELERWKKKADMALKELAEKDVKVAEVLRHVGLL
jgi:uncharacterized coiled-coil DUF342 family protein